MICPSVCPFEHGDGVAARTAASSHLTLTAIEEKALSDAIEPQRQAFNLSLSDHVMELSDNLSGFDNRHDPLLNGGDRHSFCFR